MSQSAVPPVGEGFRSLNQQVYSALLAAIAERRITPGQRLLLDELAAQLKVSRTPIRVALTRLAAEGLIQPNGRQGFVVTILSASELLELYDLRQMCECFAVEKGMHNVTPRMLDEMEGVIIRTPNPDGEPDPAERLAHVLTDREFHRTIVALARNRRLIDTFERFNIHIHGLRVGPLPVSPRERIVMDNTDHSAIIQALRDGSVAAARQAIAAHIANASRRAIASMELAQIKGDQV